MFLSNIPNLKKIVTLASMPYYAVRTGKKPGIYGTWDDCAKQVLGFKGGVYKKFSTQADALAFMGPLHPLSHKTRTTTTTATVSQSPNTLRAVDALSSNRAATRVDVGRFSSLKEARQATAHIKSCGHGHDVIRASMCHSIPIAAGGRNSEDPDMLSQVHFTSTLTSSHPAAAAAASTSASSSKGGGSTSVSCPSCKGETRVLASKKANANEGRKFHQCKACGKFVSWEDDAAAATGSTSRGVTAAGSNSKAENGGLLIYTDGACLGNRNVQGRVNPAGWGLVSVRTPGYNIDTEMYGPVVLDSISPFYMQATVGSNNTAEFQRHFVWDINSFSLIPLTIKYLSPLNIICFNCLIVH